MSESSAKALEKTESQIESEIKSESEPKKGFKWRKYLAYFAILLVLIYLLSLVILNTSWAKNKLTNRLHDKSNSDWEVGKVIWVPFGNIELNDLETSMGEGGIKIKSLSVKPSWSDLLSGSVNLTEATASEASVDIDLKWLKENLGKGEEIVFPTTPNIIPKTKPPAPDKPPSSDAKPPQKPPVKPIQKPAPKPKQTVEPKVNDLPNRWLKIEKLNLTLRNGKDVIQQVSDLSASIPFAGKPADGEVRFKFLGNEHTQKVNWNGEGIIIEEATGKIFDVNYQWQFVCQTTQPGMPFIFKFIAPEQKLDYKFDKPNVHLSVASDKISANFVLRGRLRNVNTWRGILNAGSDHLTIIENQKTHKRIEFDHTRIVGSITNGVFKIPVAEAIGHKTSVIANGTIHKNLYSYGVLRLITNDETRGFFEGVYHATKLIHIDKHNYHLLFPLDTPDRRYCDIYLDGKLTDLEARHNRSNSWQSFNLVMKKLWDFKNNELKEDGILEPSQ